MRRRFRIALPLRLQILLLLLLATLPAIGYTVDSAWRERERGRAQALQAADRLADAVSASHRQRLLGSRHLLEGVAATVRGYSEVRCAKMLAGILHHFPQYRSLTLTDAEGAVRCGAIGPESDPPRPATVAIAAPVPTEDGTFAGALQASLSLDRLEPSAFGAALPRDGSVVMFDSDGNPLGRFPADPDSSHALPPGPMLLALANENPDGFAVTGEDGVRRLFGVSHLPGSGVSLVVGVPERVALAAADRGLRRQVGGLILVWGLALAAAWFGVDLVIARRVRALARVAAAIGAGDREIRPPTPRLQSELHRFARIFGLMARRIAARERALRKALAERERLVRDIHRHARDDLQILAGLLNLQSEASRSPELRQRLREAQGRIHALGLIHDRLQAGRDLSRIDLRQLLLELCDRLIALHGTDDGRIGCDIAVPAIPVGADLAAPLALLTAEAVANALRHAFPAGRPGCIRIGYEDDGSDAIITIADDGVGFVGNLADARGSLGMRLIQALAHQIGAGLDIRSRQGVAISLTLPRDRLAG